MQNEKQEEKKNQHLPTFHRGIAKDKWIDFLEFRMKYHLDLMKKDVFIWTFEQNKALFREALFELQNINGRERYIEFEKYL